MKTEHLTAKEVAALDTTPRFGSAIQEETLALRKRSGLRYGTSVGKGDFSIYVCAYALNKKGEPTGLGDLRTIQDGLKAEDVPAALRAL